MRRGADAADTAAAAAADATVDGDSSTQADEAAASKRAAPRASPLGQAERIALARLLLLLAKPPHCAAKMCTADFKQSLSTALRRVTSKGAKERDPVSEVATLVSAVGADEELSQVFDLAFLLDRPNRAAELAGRMNTCIKASDEALAIKRQKKDNDLATVDANLEWAEEASMAWLALDRVVAKICCKGIQRTVPAGANAAAERLPAVAAAARRKDEETTALLKCAL